MLLFIGIEWLMGTRLFNFNTSHVTVYQFRLHTIRALTVHFNTSHVTVYRRWRFVIRLS